jgi:hypothetical protein
MGFPINNPDIVRHGQPGAFPIYVWFLDVADGPVWEEMDEAFGRWDAFTGEHVAFFVDPFVKDAWAVAFVESVIGNRDASRALLEARREAQNYFRNRLAERACRQLWIPRERLPLALVGCRSDARTMIAVPLGSRADVERVLWTLTTIAQEMPSSPYRDPRRRFEAGENSWRVGDEEQRLKRIEAELLHARFANRRMQFEEGMSVFGQGPGQDDWLGPISRRASLHLTGSRSAPRDLTGAVTQVALGAFDDLLRLAGSITSDAEDLASRYPDDVQAAKMARDARALCEALQTLRSLRSKLDMLMQASTAPDDERLAEAAAVMLEANFRLPGLDSNARVIARLGEETYTRLQELSRGALVASETICALSEAVSELHLDLSAVLLGYWKASEIEGRKLIVDLITYAGGVPVWDPKRGAVELLDDPAQVRKAFTAGNVGFALRNARFEDPSVWSGLRLLELGQKFNEMSDAARNRFVHRENLQDLTSLAIARRLVATPPDGILPATVRCMTEVERAEAGSNLQPPLVTKLLAALQQNSAQDAVPRALRELGGRARQSYAVGAIEKLGLGWLRDAKRSDKMWVKELLEVSAEGFNKR